MGEHAGLVLLRRGPTAPTCKSTRAGGAPLACASTCPTEVDSNDRGPCAGARLVLAAPSHGVLRLGACCGHTDEGRVSGIMGRRAESGRVSSSPRQRHGEHASLAGKIANRNLTVECLDTAHADREPEPEPTAIRASLLEGHE